MKTTGTLRVLIPAAAAVALIAGLFLWRPWDRRATALEYSGTVETREIQVGSKVGGRVIAVPVEEGQLVKTGTTLVRFECDELKAQRKQWRAKVDQAAAALERVVRGNRPDEIARADAAEREQRALLKAAQDGSRPQELKQAEADYAAAQADAVDAEATFRRMETLVRNDTVSRQQFDDSRAKRDSAAQRAESARQRLALLHAGTRAEDLRAAEDRFRQAQASAELMRKGFRKEDIAAARGSLVEAQGHVDELDARLKEAVLTAPADAVIEVVSVRPGNLVPPGQIVVTLLEPSQLWVKVYVPEPDVGRVHVGQPASVAVDSFPGRAFDGRVGQIAAQAEFLPRNVQTRDDREHEVFGVKVYVDNPEAILKSGMSATVRLR